VTGGENDQEYSQAGKFFTEQLCQGFGQGYQNEGGGYKDRGREPLGSPQQGEQAGPVAARSAAVAVLSGETDKSPDDLGAGAGAGDRVRREGWIYGLV